MIKTNKALSISCIIPLYNEEANVENIISAAENILQEVSSDWEIILIESGSSDNTWPKINDFIKNKERINLFRQEKREGFGSALRLGYSKCRKELICHLEADGPFEMIYFKKAIPILFENDCVIGYRVGKKEQGFRWSYSNMDKKGVLLRQIFHIGYNLLIKIIFGLAVRDVNFSFKIFKREYIQSLELISKGWFIDAEILLELKRKGIIPIEMPIEYKDRVRGNSTINILTPFHILYEIFAYIKHTKKKPTLKK
jgi:glycosyltransferase involved in cell wall biosynthesis